MSPRNIPAPKQRAALGDNFTRRLWTLLTHTSQAGETYLTWLLRADCKACSNMAAFILKVFQSIAWLKASALHQLNSARGREKVWLKPMKEIHSHRFPRRVWILTCFIFPLFWQRSCTNKVLWRQRGGVHGCSLNFPWWHDGAMCGFESHHYSSLRGYYYVLHARYTFLFLFFC